MSEDADKPKKKRVARRAPHGPRRKQPYCRFDTFEKVLPLVDGLEHYHLHHEGAEVTVSEFRMNDRTREAADRAGVRFADTYVVSGKLERRLFRQLADQLRTRNLADILELDRIAKLETPVELPPADPSGNF